MLNLALWLAFFLTGDYDPCPLCKTRGGSLQYSVVYEVHEPAWRKCRCCAGVGWLARERR